jgi:hypothetical protein
MTAPTPRVLFLTCGLPEGAMIKIARRPENSERIALADLYSLDTLSIAAFKAILVSMHADQRFLAMHADRLDRYLRHGGTIVANGHIAYPFLNDMAPFRAIEGYRLDDLMVKRETFHPIWNGVAEAELTFRRGVAGFYGRGWHQPPSGATIIHTIGRRRLPLDFIYPVGSGRVLFHGGNDLWQYVDAIDTTGRIVPQLFDWMLPKEPNA